MKKKPAKELFIAQQLREHKAPKQYRKHLRNPRRRNRTKGSRPWGVTVLKDEKLRRMKQEVVFMRL